MAQNKPVAQLRKVIDVRLDEVLRICGVDYRQADGVYDGRMSTRCGCINNRIPIDSIIWPLIQLPLLGRIFKGCTQYCRS